ncbi:hypothetical protein FJ548_19565 [Mesorhizobium sp. B2-4-17]|nr:hypothetical protein FJ548_19565 [Mesorhizobium sp. B2-4-17]
MDSCEGDPHPNPPHKGEGTLPRAPLLPSLTSKTCTICHGSASTRVSLPLVGVRRTGETRGSPRQVRGGTRRAKASASQRNCPAPRGEDTRKAKASAVGDCLPTN